MVNKNKIFGPPFVFPSIIIAMLVPSIAAAQVTYYYSNNTEINHVAFILTVTNPQNQTTNSKTLPLQVELIWNVSLEPLLDTHMPVKGYAYAIDNKPIINMEPNGSVAVSRKEGFL
jgi:hypothetical protein